METVHEEWRPVPGHPGYEASNLGRIKRLAYSLQCVHNGGRVATRNKPERIISQTRHHRGYLICRIGLNATPEVHRIIALAWLGEPDDKSLTVNHISGDKTDNRPQNLEWITRGENTKHAHVNGLINNFGERNGVAKLTNEQVRTMRSLSESGIPNEQLAREFGVSRELAWSAVTGRTYRTA